MKREPVLAIAWIVITVLVALGIIQDQNDWMMAVEALFVAATSVWQRAKVTPVAKKEWELPRD